MERPGVFQRPAFARLKGTLYEGGIRVPMMARWPGRIQRRSQSDHSQRVCDMLPTFCDWLACAPPRLGRHQHRAHVRQGDRAQHDALYWELGRQQAVRRGAWKAVRRFDKQRGWTVQLFQLEEDPAEEHDLAADQPEMARELEALMQSMRTPSGVPRWERF